MLKPLIAAALLVASPVGAQEVVLYPRAQALADGIVSRNHGMIDAIIHVSPNANAANVVVAAHLRHANGEASGDDDLSVVTTGAPLVEIQKDGRRLGIVVQLRDARHRAIGALGLMYAYTPGDDVEASIRRSFAIRDALARRIDSRAALVGQHASS